MNILRIFLINLIALTLLSKCKSTEHKYSDQPIKQSITRLIGEKARYFVVDSIASDNGKDVFEIESVNNKIVLRGNTQTAIGYAFNWYLRYYCHSQFSKAGEQINIPVPLPEIPLKIRIVSPFQHRYYMNYCTFNYTMSFWDWERWEKEIDWMAINGINMPLAIIGTEAVWQNTLQKFGFTDSEIKSFIPGPAYTAWWLMGNLEGWGGPVSQDWIDSRVSLQQKILKRMHELEMTPVFQGFYGMVPDIMRQKFPKNNIHYGGIWAGKNGFQRPAFLDPSDSLFASMAKVFYNEQTKLYGETSFYGGDPFHEGGETEGIDITKSAGFIHGAMLKAHPESTWVLQGWWDNPNPKLLDGTVHDHVMILDLFAESKPQWVDRKGYDGRKWIWCSLLNFGSKVGMVGKLDTYATEPIRALNTDFGKSVCGIGTMMEGCETNPVNYELIYEMAWRKQTPDVSAWVNDFVYARYGKDSPKAREAWQLLYKSVYSCPTKQEGSSESIFCARGAMQVTGAFRWGTIRINYDPNDLQNALKLLLECANECKEIDTYQYDIVDITRQVIANYGQKVYADMIMAFNTKDRAGFENVSGLFLRLISYQDSLLATRKEFLLGNWLESAKSAAVTKNERDLFEWNARTLITVWGNRGVSEELHDYSNREWSGLLKDFYLPRWELFIDSLQHEIVGQRADAIDYYVWENAWTLKKNIFPNTPAPNSVTTAQGILKALKLD
ncbi:MAG: alpha-N-acetylglucosaminidase [Bacteroidales bacterium]|nr:alpha-N-acetylglucosaminidase [Bacteroidales bacterium]